MLQPSFPIKRPLYDVVLVFWRQLAEIAAPAPYAYDQIAVQLGMQAGFLYGLGSAGEDIQARLSKDALEVLSDFSEVTRLRTDAEESESSEADYSEIVEYMRVGVMLIFEELRGRPRPGDGVHLLH